MSEMTNEEMLDAYDKAEDAYFSHPGEETWRVSRDARAAVLARMARNEAAETVCRRIVETADKGAEELGLDRPYADDVEVQVLDPCGIWPIACTLGDARKALVEKATP